jgi:hypothetical protein
MAFEDRKRLILNGKSTLIDTSAVQAISPQNPNPAIMKMIEAAGCTSFTIGVSNSFAQKAGGN